MAKKLSAAIFLFFIILFQNSFSSAQSEALRKAEKLILKGAYSQAGRVCEKILTHHRKASVKSRAYYLLGICLLKEGKFDEARKKFNIILSRYSDSKFYDDAQLGIADSYLLAGDYRKASINYEKFIRNFPQSELLGLARSRLKQSGKGGPPYSNSYFSVQIGSFAKKSNAERLRDELINAGFQAYILDSTKDNLYRVRIGKFNTRLQAELLEQRLRSEGYPTRIFP